ncbi:bifunctional DNA primase/polymerase [Virgibacillus soli]|uniref:Bifunctional DNA primase/polymerase n=1 Tax=Paracerasibacillus soli TaxID=480284 RepID=A0ABU5CUT2_9BACI|nr:bifunctional DNA primase/polymerase [Virgibacillus soli]MDY0410128.1 bifunctional DNA primase/polymerase [Virgibacillus soli]
MKDATKDEKQVIKYWSEKPYLNIGVATGKVSGFFAVDVDNKIHRGTGNNGFETLEQLKRDNGNLPDTVEQITGSGGSHFLFKYQAGIKNKVNAFPSIDIRGDGGYIVVSPSIHNSGNKYCWEFSSHPLKVEIAQAPEWLLNSISPQSENNGKRKYSAKPVSEYLSILQGVSEGERNNSLTTLIGHLLARSIDYREALEIVNMWNETRVNPPLEVDTVTTAFNNILRREAEKR